MERRPSLSVATSTGKSVGITATGSAYGSNDTRSSSGRSTLTGNETEGIANKVPLVPLDVDIDDRLLRYQTRLRTVYIPQYPPFKTSIAAVLFLIGMIIQSPFQQQQLI
jgi:hypothetical protein